jgi:hypothetical protein
LVVDVLLRLNNKPRDSTIERIDISVVFEASIFPAEHVSMIPLPISGLGSLLGVVESGKLIGVRRQPAIPCSGMEEVGVHPVESGLEMQFPDSAVQQRVCFGDVGVIVIVDRYCLWRRLVVCLIVYWGGRVVVAGLVVKDRLDSQAVKTILESTILTVGADGPGVKVFRPGGGYRAGFEGFCMNQLR